MAKVFIYGLKCPIAGVIRYVGKSTNPQKRLIRHIAGANRNETDHHTARWLRKLCNVGLRPELVILHEVLNEEKWQDVEREFIAMAEIQGWRLTNSTAGGEGLDFLDAISKEKWASNLSKAMKLIWSTPERRNEARERIVKSWQDPDCRKRRIDALKRNGESPKFRQRMTAINKEIHSRPEVKAKHAEAIKATWADGRGDSRRAALASEECHQKMSESAKARWTDAEKGADIRAVNANPESREKKRQAALRRATSEYRAMMAEKTRLSWLKRRTVK